MLRPTVSDIGIIKNVGDDRPRQDCISFAACNIYKELERQLKERNNRWSPEGAIDIVKTITYKVTFQSPYSNKKHSRLLLKTEEHRTIIKLFNLEN